MSLNGGEMLTELDIFTMIISEVGTEFISCI